MHKRQTIFFRRISPFGIAPVKKKAYKARTRWYRRPFRRFINTRLRKKKCEKKKEWTEAIKKKFKRKTMTTRERRHTIVGPSLISWTHLQGIVLIAWPTPHQHSSLDLLTRGIIMTVQVVCGPVMQVWPQNDLNCHSIASCHREPNLS